jgi:nitrogen fixation protein NifU and related proteins
MFDLKSLYQEVIIDHNRRPRNYHKLLEANRVAEGYNPLCGDQLTLYLQLEDGTIRDLSFEGAGCAISTASASLMTEHLKGKTEREAHEIFECFRGMVTEEDGEADDAKLGKLSVLAGVKAFPARIKCATLCWHTLHSALNDEHKTHLTD